MSKLLPLLVCLPLCLFSAVANGGIIMDWAVACDAAETRVFILYNRGSDSTSPQFEFSFETLNITPTGGTPTSVPLNTAGVITAVFAALDSNGVTNLPEEATRAEFSPPQNDVRAWQWVEITIDPLLDDTEYTFALTANRIVHGPHVWTTTVECNGGADEAAPEVACAVAVDSLWPPNGKFVNVGLDFLVIDDVDDDPTVDVHVFSDESSLLTRAKKGADAVVDEKGLHLRAERSGRGDGRVYLVVITATDDAGNIGIDACSVVVAHDQSDESVQSVDAQAAAAVQYFLDNAEVPPGYSAVD